MPKHSFHDVRNNKKMLQYGAKCGMGVFQPKPPKKAAKKEQKPKTEKE